MHNKMKKIYIKPSTEIILVSNDGLLKTASEITYDSVNVDTQGSGTDPTVDAGGTVWIDAKGNNMWEDEE
jgi:hypothetical protein